MIFSNEPGYYLEGAFGIRLESLVTVVDASPNLLKLETLTLAPFDRSLILFGELCGSHKKWLNTYHQQVYKTLSPHLPEEIKSWLYEQTRPF
jgi:Xaa-Pro aminopeptidase